MFERTWSLYHVPWHWRYPLGFLCFPGSPPEWISTLLGSSFEGWACCSGSWRPTPSGPSGWPGRTWSSGAAEQGSGGWLEGNSPMVRSKKPTIWLVRNWDDPISDGLLWMIIIHEAGHPHWRSIVHGRAGRVSEHSSVGNDDIGWWSWSTHSQFGWEAPARSWSKNLADKLSLHYM